MTTLRRYWLAVFFTGSAFAIAALYYGRLPERIPVHWGLDGGADGWMSKRAGALALPLTTLIVTGLLIALAPKRSQETNSSFVLRVSPGIVAAIAAFLFYVTIIVVNVQMGMERSLPSYLSVGLGVLLTVVGNGLGKVMRNRVLGIRTPWTLASEEVWSRTHRAGGWLLVLAGFAAIVAGLLGWGAAPGVCAVIAAAIVSTVYSFVISRRFDRDNPDHQQ